MKINAPIVVFTYKRLDTLKKTITSLNCANLSKESDLIVFSDAAKSEKDLHQVILVREYLKTITGFKNIKINLANKNKGLANSIIDGVTKVVAQYGKVIVLEDDLEVSENFLVFMNQSLEFYEQKQKVFSVSGFSLKINIPSDYKYDVYFTPRGLSWGWATWEDRWNTVDWEVKGFKAFKTDTKARRAFALGGTDLYPMLEKQMESNLDSWAIRWFYSQFKNNTVTVYPNKSTVKNMGFDEDATHTNVYNRYKISFDNSGKQEFVFNSDVILNKQILKSFQRYYTVFARIFYGRIITPLYKIKQSFLKKIKKV